MYRNTPPTWAIALILALVGGTLLALGHVIGGVVLVALALICGWAWDRMIRDGDDHSGFYGN
jgi:hypothetical protein